VHIAPHFEPFFCEFLKANLMRFTQLSTLVFLLVLFATCFFTSCDSNSEAVAKPHAFPKIEFPKNDSMQIFDKNFCQFSFKYPKYIAFEQDTSFFDEKAKDICWFNLIYPTLNARVHCSYYPINSANKLDKLVADAYDLAGKHNIKADYIDELPVQKPNHVSGMIFDIQGAAASPFQFFLTDSTHHFFRGSLYFNTQARPDSLAPVFNFVKTDIINIINTFEWSK
jgi:gliding motility-associated lipoprotein GldD